MRITEVGGNQYHVGKLDVFVQLQVARRLLPVIQGFAVAALTAAQQANVKLEGMTTADQLRMVVPHLGDVSNVIANMADKEFDFVMKTCLGSVTRVVDGRAQPLMTKGGVLLFQDLSPMHVLSLVQEVIEENLGGFFDVASTLKPAPASPSSDSPAPPG